MDVGGFGKAKGKGKDGKDNGKGISKDAPPKTDKACFNCGKKGHLHKEANSSRTKPARTLVARAKEREKARARTQEPWTRPPRQSP
eukprot:599887-Amphidinium_carterae.1